ncbi:MAG: putative methicillin resistance protein [Actinomycetia bacterium]|nr:putative methicillin resistance protein [Actinomycetes bacterium]
MSAASVRAWQDAYDACEHATFFHGPLWSEIWSSYSNGRFQPAPLRVDFTDGSTAIVGITKERTRLGVERHHLSPAGCYGGWVSAQRLTDGHRSAIARYLMEGHSVAWRASPVDAEVARRQSGVSDDFTHEIDLSDGGAAAHARWHTSARNKVRRAQRAGAKVREAGSWADWKAYDALYRESLCRWGHEASVVYGSSLFEMLGRVDSPEVRLWLAEVDGAPCAGAVVVAHRTRASYWHGASTPARCPGSSYLLQWELCEALATGGIETYDLNPSGGHAGVAFFKSRLGADLQPAPFVRRRHWLEPIAETLRPLLSIGGAA